METTKIAEKIQSKIALLDTSVSLLKERAEARANAIGAYDKALAQSMLMLKEESGHPATMVEKLAKGNCYKERIAMELAESGYKSLITGINVIQAQLNGYQSLNRHLSEV